MKLVHEGFGHSRTKIEDDQGKLEKALADAWKAEQESYVLHQILTDAVIDPVTFMDMRPPEERTQDPPVTERDAVVAATIVRWIGTHIGRAFLEKAYRDADWTIRFTSPSSRKIDEEVREMLRKNEEKV